MKATTKMTRALASYALLCVFLSVALQSGGPKLFADAASIRRLSAESQESHPLAPFRPSTQNVDIEEIITISQSNTTNTTNATSLSPTPTPAPSPTSNPTAEPTKHYEPEPDDEGEEEKKKGPKIGIIFGWIIFAFALIWVLCYFRDAILFFFANAWNNTRRYGCKGCLQSFFPCIAGSRSVGGGSEPLDQIIFETEDPNAPLMT